MERINIETTQNVQINYKVASVGERIVAVILDFIFLSVYVLALLFLFSKMGIKDGMLAFLVMIGPVFYSLIFELFVNGQSLGKIIMKIRVVRVDGGEPGFINYFIRWVFRLVDIFLTSGICGLVTIILNGKGQRLGDILAGTTIVRVGRQVNLSDTIFEEIPSDYKVCFEQVATMSDRDISLVKQVVKQIDRISDPVEKLQFSLRARKKIQEKLGIETQMKPEEFFRTLIADYNCISRK